MRRAPSGPRTAPSRADFLLRRQRRARADPARDGTRGHGGGGCATRSNSSSTTTAITRSITRSFIPDVREALDRLHAAGAQLAILTNKPVRISHRIMEGLGVAPLFFRIYGGNSFEHKKPHPHRHRHTARGSRRHGRRDLDGGRLLCRYPDRAQRRRVVLRRDLGLSAGDVSGVSAGCSGRPAGRFRRAFPPVLMTCVFCKIVSGEVAAEIVWRTDDSVAFLDHRPLFPGHVLLIPAQHIVTLADLPAAQVGPLFAGGAETGASRRSRAWRGRNLHRHQQQGEPERAPPAHPHRAAPQGRWVERLLLAEAWIRQRGASAGNRRKDSRGVAVGPGLSLGCD